MRNTYLYATKEQFNELIINEGLKIAKHRERTLYGLFASPKGDLYCIVSSDSLGYKYYKVKTKSKNNAGYPIFTLDGHTYTVHRIIADTFIGVSKGMEVDHKDGDKTNNIVSNLEVVTHSENMKRAWKNGQIKNPNFKYGKYNIKTETLTINGLKYKLSPEEYIEYRKCRGLNTYKFEKKLRDIRAI